MYRKVESWCGHTSPPILGFCPRHARSAPLLCTASRPCSGVAPGIMWVHKEAAKLGHVADVLCHTQANMPTQHLSRCHHRGTCN